MPTGGGAEGAGDKAKNAVMNDHIRQLAGGPNPAVGKLLHDEPVTVAQADARKVVDEVAASGKVVDLANMHVAGQSKLFDYSATELPRSAMPQLGDASTIKNFTEQLREKGIEANVEKVSPLSLHATQNEMDATKVDSITEWIEQEPTGVQQQVIAVAKDGAVLDGTHRWAATSLYALDHPGFNVSVLRANASIHQLLNIANQFDVEKGIAHQAIDAVAPAGNQIVTS